MPFRELNTKLLGQADMLGLLDRTKAIRVQAKATIPRFT